MKGKVKEYLLSVDYCAFMVAILLARHEVNNKNSEKQWSSAEISEELNNLAYGATTNFHVDTVALQHGMSIFQKQLRNRGLLAVTMGSDALGVRDFYDLVGATRMIEIKFVGYQKSPEHETESDLLCRILAIRTDLLLKNNYPILFHPSPASVLYELHLPMIRSLQAQKVDKKDVTVSKKVRMSRKSPSKLGAKTIKKNTIDLLDTVKKNFGENNVEFYLNSAIIIEESKKRKLRDSTESSDEDSENLDDDDDDNLALNDIENDERVLEMASKVPAKYIIFENDDKKNVIALFKVIREVAEEREYVACDKIAALTTAKILNRINYYSTIKARCILRWYSVEDKTIEKSGPKIDNQFVSEVWGNLLLCILERKPNEVDGNDVRIILNVTYSYAIVETAARAIQQCDHWKDNAKIQAIKFSHKWIHNFLQRGGLSRRKITRDDKNLPSDEEIARVLKIGQDLYVRNGHSPSSTWNYDETAFTWCLAPTHMWCPQNQQRATNIGISNSKMRITAVIAVNGEGRFAPLMLIVKHSASSDKRPDQTEMTVIRQMHKKEDFRISDGWSLEVWSRELTINNVTATHKVNYLIHGVTGHVITSQCKAWNDTVRVCLWFDIIIKPLLGERMLLWCDNCGSHKTTSVMDVIDEIGVDVAFLPKNMTGELQVLDLVVNGPLKAHVRTNRANVLYQSFQEYKAQLAADSGLPLPQRRNPEFSPPKPTMLGGIKDLILLFDGPFKETKFKDCINRTFIKTGTIPIHRESENIPHTFVVYRKEEQNGTMSIVPLGTMDLAVNDAVVNLPGTLNEENDVDALERIVLNYYAQNYDALQEDDDEDDDSTDDDTD